MYRDERRGRGFRGQGHWGRGGQRRYYHDDNNADESNGNRYEEFNRRRGGNRDRGRSEFSGSWKNRDGGRSEFSGSRDNRARGRSEFSCSWENRDGSREEFSGSRDNRARDRSEFSGSWENRDGSREEFSGSRDNRARGRSEFSGLWDNRDVAKEELYGSRDNRARGRSEFSGSRDNRGGSRAEFSGSRDNRGGSRAEFSGSRDMEKSEGRNRPPPGLKGKEIGLWYARRGKANREQKEKNMRPEVKMVHHQQQNIRQLLHEVKSSRDCPPQPGRSGAELPPESEEDEDMDWFDKKATYEFPEEAGFSVTDMGGASCSSYSTNRKLDNLDVDYIELPEFSEMKEFLDENDYVMEDDEDVVLPYTPPRVDHELNKSLLVKFEKRKQNHLYQHMKKLREQLPIYKERQRILDMIQRNQVIVLSGQTGCGKTTQVPQYILDDYIEQGRGSECRIICTQPRRISAVSVAERVAEERAESCGNDNSVGYKIRVEQKMPRADGSILYCTSGILLKILEGDPLLEMVTHVFLDEIHERDLHSDFLLIVLKDILQKRPEIKLILMSATLNAEAFSEYFNNCPMIHAEGFTYPVKEYLLEDVIELLRYEVPEEMLRTSRRPRKKWGKQSGGVETEEEEMREAWLRNLESGFNTDKRYSGSTLDTLYDMDLRKVDLNLIKELIRHIITSKPDGAILVFLPGMSLIKDLHNMLSGDQFFTSSGCNLIPLHSLMPTAKEAFKRPPQGERKIIIATNIAETSITIDDVVYVIDCGQTKLTGFSPENDLATLDTVLCSHANAKQRRGRTGRTQPGECYHLYTSLQESLMVDQHPPEILRTRLEELCLTIKCLNLGQVMPFVKKAMQPPSIEAVQLAIVKLQNLNALDKDENLLPLGRLLAQIPTDPLTGKMILFGAIFGCLDPIITIAACLSFKDPFLVPMGKEQLADSAKLRLAEGSLSDHLLLVKAFRRWERARRRGTEGQLCWDHFMSNSTLILIEKMRRQLAGMLYALGFLKSEDPSQFSANRNSDNLALVKAIVSAGLYPNVAKIKTIPKKHGNMKFRLKDGGKCELHPKSLVSEVKAPGTQWVVYHKKMKTTSVFLYDCTLVSPYSLLFFGGDLKHIYEDDVGTVCVDDWIRFKASPDVVSLVKELRHELDYVLDGLIKERNGSDLDPKSEKGAIIKAIIDLVTTEAEENNFEYEQR